MKKMTMALSASAIALMAAAPAHAILGYDVKSVRDMEVSGSTFNQELAREYKSFAIYEADRMVDWIDADYFAAKALTAASGQTPAPEATADWNLDADDANELAAARADLLAKLNDGARTQYPDLAARAQANFDCWMEQQEEDWQTRHINACKRTFQAAMAAMGPTEVSAPAQPKFERIEDGAVVFFDHDSSALNPAAETKLKALANRLMDDRSIVVTVTGHADRSGSAEYNEALSAQRAATVATTLQDMGLTLGDLEELEIEARGEAKPAVYTEDGVREPANRRVVVDAYARGVTPKQTAELK